MKSYFNYYNKNSQNAKLKGFRPTWVSRFSNNNTQVSAISVLIQFKN